MFRERTGYWVGDTLSQTKFGVVTDRWEIADRHKKCHEKPLSDHC